jgi:hypothetical protein
MDWHSDRHPSSQRVSIFSSEIEFIAGLASEQGASETGGELYGLQTHAGRPVIMYATPPGPKAIHEIARFQQDHGFFVEANSLLLNEFAIQYNGSWHSHHGLSIRGPSPGDIRTSHSLASRNNYQRLCQFVLTFEGDPGRNGYLHRNHRRSSKTFRESGRYSAWNKFFTARNHDRTDTDFFSRVETPTFIAIHCFLYLDAKSSQPVQCPIKVIPGVSPFRMALDQGRSILARRETLTFPLDRILYESVAHEPCDDKRTGEFPIRLHKQFIRLPLWVQDEATVRFREGMIILSLPTQGGSGQVITAYTKEPPHPVVGAYYSEGSNCDRPMNLSETAVCHGQFTQLSTIYKRAIRALGIGR